MQSDQQLLASILDHTHMLVAYLDTGFNFVRVNRAYARADGKTEDYFPGRNHFDLYPNEENTAIFRQVLANGVPYFAHAKAFEYPEHPERGVSYWDWSLVPTRGETGEITGLVLTLADVTQVVETRESLRRERDLADSLIRTARAIILVLDEDGNIMRFNPYLEQLGGYRLDEVAGKSWFDTFIPVAERARIKELFATAISGTETRGSCNAILTRSGQVRIIQWFDTTLRDSQGSVSGLLAVGIDNTELMMSQEDLMLFKTVVGSSSEAIAIADERGNVIYANDAHDALYGTGRRGIPGGDRFDAFVDNGVPCEVASRIRSGECVTWEGEAGARGKDGHAFAVWMRLDCACSGGAVRNYILMSHDITAQKHGEQQRLEHEKRLQQTLIREIHHRIKNHLQGVIGLLRNSMDEDGVKPGSLDALIGKINALAGVYDVSARHIGPILPLSDVLGSVIAAFGNIAGSMCAIEFFGDDGRAHITSEEVVPITLIFNELLTNACKHRERVSVPVRVSMVGDSQQMEVRIANAGALPAGFSFQERSCIGMGLSLIHSLLPRKCASLTIEHGDGEVLTRLRIVPPLLVASGDDLRISGGGLLP